MTRHGGLLTPSTEAESVNDFEIDDAEQSSPFYMTQAPYDPHRAVKVIIVGAGIGGIAASCLLPAKVPNLEYVVFERNDTVGGTWALNTYPGVRCDVPSHVYQLTFAPNPRWSEYYAPGHEIREYYEKVVKDFGVGEHLRLRHEVLRAEWNEALSHWEVTVQDLVTGDVFVETAEFFISAQGRLNVPKKPYIPGLETEFEGHVCHTAEWDDSYNFSGKKIAIVGNGASGQQLLVNILPQVDHIDHYARSKQWILPTFSSGFLEAKADLPGAYVFTEREKERFASDPPAYLDFRRDLERSLHDAYHGSIAGTAENEAARQRCVDAMLKRLGGDDQWLKRLLPDYAVGCKRPTPSPGYLEALRGSQVTYIDSGISHATRTGLVAVDGKERSVDAIILATGFENGFLPLFPTIGKGGLDLAKHWSEDGPAGYPETYFGIMAPDMPNYFAVLQAQSYAAGGTVPLHCETSVTFIAKAMRKIQREGYKALYPSQEATADFNEYVGAYHEDKVIGDSCNSWLKAGKGKSRPLVGWPGTGHHRINICRDPRWEDFVFERSEPGRRNRYEYFGNGWTQREKEADPVALTSYLHPAGSIDLATLHETWNE
ncbi:cyclohexanone monooxygenase [Exophiala viscosa]|uniref:cyclohexanone monooxygenase n=1 Tax=Exophiala viscosa TaxID=2486360 RepID=UPI00219E86BD|nr:cyclohexanone monooxygenase [Exophiala viscosa]